MNKLLFALTFIGLLVSKSYAKPYFVAGEKYAIQCQYYESGSICPGSSRGVNPIVYYSTSASLDADCYWYVIEDVTTGYYSFRNASTNEYLVYDAERDEQRKKGLNFSSSNTSDASKWRVNPLDQGGYYIESVSSPGQYFNMRVDGSLLMGTYRSYNSSNSTFFFVDSKGNYVSEKEETPNEETNQTHGLTDDGYFWERTGTLNLPIVASSVSDPILYKIKNVRSGKYLKNLNNQLYQDANDGDYFYFRKNYDGYSICTEDGKCVLTDYPTDNVPIDLKKLTSITGTNYWTFNFYDDINYSGYTIEKLTQRPVYSESDYWWQEPVITNGQSKYLCWNDCQDSFICLYNMYDAGSTFVFYSQDVRHAQHLMENGIIFPGVELMGFRSFIDTLRINDKELLYDEAEGTYITTATSDARESGTFTPTINFKAKVSDATYEMRIDGVAPNSDGIIELMDFDCSVQHTLNLYKDGVEIETAPIRFTYLNLIEINYPSCNGNYYTTGTMRVTQANIPGYDSIYTAAFKYRGATAQGFNKKSYAVKMKEADGVTSKDVEFLGLREDNNWILDAMAVDKACMRNRVSTDLWNDFATAPYHKRAGFEKKARHGTRGEFAEVYLNGKYHGIYCFTEKMDRKQLKLKKIEMPTSSADQAIVHGTLYKSSQWSYEVLMGHEIDVNYYPKSAPRSYDNNKRSETWASFEIKYPDWEEERIDWGPLWNAVNFVATTGDVMFYKDFDKYFDYDNVTDYYLFIELMLATDNHGKNMFFYNYDQTLSDDLLRQKIGVAPWDLDGSWGRRWDGKTTVCAPDQEFDKFLWDYEHGNLTLFTRLKTVSSLRWNHELASRYAELRASHFSEENLCKRFQEYADLFETSGAIKREQKQWSSYHSAILQDVEYIQDWIKERLDFLDKQYGYVNTNSVDYVELNNISVKAGQGYLLLYSDSAGTTNLYSINGQLIKVINFQPGITRIDNLSQGVYILNGKKVLVSR